MSTKIRKVKTRPGPEIGYHRKASNQTGPAAYFLTTRPDRNSVSFRLFAKSVQDLVLGSENPPPIQYWSIPPSYQACPPPFSTSTVTVGPAAQKPFKSRPNHQNNIKSQRRSKRKGLGQGAEPRVGSRVPPQALGRGPPLRM